MITVLMGAPAAGKSTWITKNSTGLEYIYNTEAVRINRDLDIAAFMDLARRKAIKAAESGLDVIADGTHTISTHRKVWLNLGDRLDVKKRLILFDTPLAILLRGNSIREYPAPRNVVVDHYRRFNKSRNIVKNEGWDSIEIIKRVM
jgi:predicted kinase